MAENKKIAASENDEFIEKAQAFWSRYSKQITIALAVLVIGIGGWYSYRNFVQKPKAEKALDVIFKAEEYYRIDSIGKALNGDGINKGFIAVVRDYGGTETGNLARFYAGDCYLRLGDFANAAKYLEDFSTDSKQVQARAYKLLADAYSEMGKNDDAISFYKKASNHFTDDSHNSAEYLFFAASLAENAGKATEAIDLYKQVLDKYPTSTSAGEAEKNLAKLGVYNYK